MGGGRPSLSMSAFGEEIAHMGWRYMRSGLSDATLRTITQRSSRIG